MLNISHNQLNKSVDITDSKSGKRVFHSNYYKYFNRFLGGSAILGFIILFLPWTQNITGRGNVTTLTPDQRPQTIQSQIPGRIEEWFVREGAFVKKGDTIIRISEVKTDYFDPKLVERTTKQRDAKALSVESYQGKVKANDVRISALISERRLKLEQAENKLIQAKYKVESDSIDLEAAKTAIKIAETKYNRADSLFKDGFTALKNVEDATVKLRETQAKLISQNNKLLASKNEVINAKVEISRVNVEFSDKISKAESDKFSAQSSQFDTEAQVTKLDNQVSNYKIRNGLLFVTAPYDGYINKVLVPGIGQTFKEGEKLVGIMPANVDLAVETFVSPIDLPLIHVGEKVRVQFDGWPAIVFRGWPNVSYGTYGAKVVAVENFITLSNGKFRVLLAPDEDDQKWPKDVRAGSGAFTMALLDDVPIWFELWRQLNGFPPNYYQPETATNKTAKKK
ncbi:HlyD family secretion protein [Winogradskyella immobilis]|uniref:HlyD family efflux transporter periplasmic adaptor subunit n=1 Tax=Winogradskyella immobilis TaxID=2816852 RepID=A0ABS8ENE4_9FLAO|nr:HlyD family efflux transporter periplasmic adaptor subunit [Winogradskyella immobilis]MCC1484724.1 HlyD family efflux transporter periplasmic adaptor subunit [Winogradskyella immobilis]MCG0016816.1 HlyD family secretion protein [Winogradskyella immobilis]